jgi:dienelactone hydrolase
VAQLGRKEVDEMKKIISLLVFVTLILIAFVHGIEASESIKLVTEDNKNVSATYYPPPLPNAPGLILIPDTRCDGSVFVKQAGDFPKELNKAGLAVLVTDLRYKDLIASARRPDEQIKLLQSQDLYAPVNYEIKSALDFLSKKGLEADRIALLGTSYGSRVALHSGVKYKTKALVLVSLSGQEALPGKAVKELLEEFGENPILFMTSQKDWGGNYKAAEDNKLYFGWAKGKKELKIWPGSAHGVDILNNTKAADFTIMWLKGNL